MLLISNLPINKVKEVEASAAEERNQTQEAMKELQEMVMKERAANQLLHSDLHSKSLELNAARDVCSLSAEFPFHFHFIMHFLLLLSLLFILFILLLLLLCGYYSDFNIDHPSYWSPIILITHHIDHPSYWSPIILITHHIDHSSYWPPIILIIITHHIDHSSY